MITRFQTLGLSKLAPVFCLIGAVALVTLTRELRASDAGTTPPAQAPAAIQTSTISLKHYENSDWKFSINTPANWNRFPPVLSNSIYEVVRFESEENGIKNLLIVFRSPRDPRETAAEWLEKMQKALAKGGFGNFAVGRTTIGSKTTATLEFDKSAPDRGLWSCRYYMIPDGTLGYVLGFGSNQRGQMLDLWDRIAKTFQTLE